MHIVCGLPESPTKIAMVGRLLANARLNLHLYNEDELTPVHIAISKDCYKFVIFDLQKFDGVERYARGRTSCAVYFSWFLGQSCWDSQDGDIGWNFAEHLPVADMKDQLPLGHNAA